MVPTAIPKKGKADQTGSPVLLVVPPFQGLKSPVLSAGQLKGNLIQAGFTAETLYLNLRYAERINPRVHEWISGTGPYLLGEFIFSNIANDLTDVHIKAYVEEVLIGSEFEPDLEIWFPGKDPVTIVKYLVKEAREFIRNEAIEEILKRDPWVVGCSSTFQSNCCSLSLIKEIKKRRPEIITVIGGANCEGEMGEELIKRYPEIDFVGRGECDRTLIDLLENLKAGGEIGEVQGFLSQKSGKIAPPSRPLNGAELDQNAYPDFSDYFSQLLNVNFCDQIHPGLEMETSRGCWWGEKQHCTFCAFNRLGMVFRSKSPERAIDEMSALIEKYGIHQLMLTDNILELDYFKSLLPSLAEHGKAEFFCEIKANLKREHMEILRRANFRWLQPGIESLSDKSLKLMRKGTTELQNVQTLKWATEYGIKITWNWLFGFPGEDEEEVGSLANVVEAIHHLEPAGCATVLYIERFAPYQATPEEWNLEGIKPAKAYSHVYPFPDEALNRLAFFFDCGYFEDKEKSEAFKKLQKIVGRWVSEHASAHLIAVPKNGTLQLFDTRRCAKRFIHRLKGLECRIYEYCDQNRSEQGILHAFDGEAPPEKIREILHTFVDDFLMLESGGRYVSLGTDPQFDYKNYPKTFPGGDIVEAEQSNGRVDGRLKRRLMQMLTFRMPPSEILESLKNKYRMAVVRRVLAATKKPFPQNGMTVASREEPAKSQEELGESKVEDVGIQV